MLTDRTRGVRFIFIAIVLILILDSFSGRGLVEAKLEDYHYQQGCDSSSSNQGDEQCDNNCHSNCKK